VGTCVAVYQRFMMLTALNRYKLSAMVLIIFSHQDVPSLVSHQDVHLSSGEISGYAFININGL